MMTSYFRTYVLGLDVRDGCCGLSGSAGIRRVIPEAAELVKAELWLL
jgi:hypothetical protein